MKKLGFASSWIHLIMERVFSSSFSILVNEFPQQVFIPQRGLRQSYPLSSYLYILCVEVLSCQLHAAEYHKLIIRVPIARGVMSMNHLFFTDDSLVFCRANMGEWDRLNQILRLYEEASCQKLNREKTSVFFFF